MMNRKNVRWCHDLGDLIDFIAYVVLSAPDDFPEEDQMDFERAFAELRHGFDCAAKEVEGARLTPLRVMLEDAYGLYKTAQTNPGAWKLQELQQSLMKL